MSIHSLVQRRQPATSLVVVCSIAAISLAMAMGIGRFAFTPVLPLMVRDGSLPPSSAAWLAASNYLGYLVGALTAGRLGFAPPTLVRVSLAGIVVATTAMGATASLAAWLLLRFAAGALSAWALVATSAWVLQRLTQAGRTELSGFVYAGVGFGMAIAGLFCLMAARPGVSASRLWIEFGALAVLLATYPIISIGRLPEIGAINGPKPASPTSTRYTGLVVCYGMLGLGYILPATFLPALARKVVDDPQIFGFAWPVFGIAAGISTMVISQWFGRINRLRIWAVSHLLMAAGVILPSIRLTTVTIALAALLVGSTFMVVTMVGLQEARARAPYNPTVLLGLMTAAFAMGQLVGPILLNSLDILLGDHNLALDHALRIAALGLTAAAVYLWRQSRD